MKAAIEQGRTNDVNVWIVEERNVVGGGQAVRFMGDGAWNNWDLTGCRGGSTRARRRG